MDTDDLMKGGQVESDVSNSLYNLHRRPFYSSLSTSKSEFYFRIGASLLAC